MRDLSIKLRSPNPNDYKTLFLWFTDVDDLYLWTDDRNTYSFDIFVDVFNRRLRNVFDIFYVLDVNGESVGFTYTYRANKVDGYTFLCFYLSPKYRKNKLGSIIGWYFVHHLFSNYNLRKIYVEIYSYNRASLKLVVKNGFEQEGCLKSHRWHDNQFWDLQIYALTRERFLLLPQPLQENE